MQWWEEDEGGIIIQLLQSEGLPCSGEKEQNISHACAWLSLVLPLLTHK